MENDYKYFDRFDAYLDNILSVEEKQVFEKEINENISFQQEFEQYKLLVEGIKESRKQELKDYIKNNTKKEIKGVFRNNGKFYAIAAVIVFFVSVYIVFDSDFNTTNEQYAMEKSEDTSLTNIEIPGGNQMDRDKNLGIAEKDSDKIEQPTPIEHIKDIKIDNLIASNTYPILTYRDYLKNQKPIALKSNSKTEETVSESSSVSKDKFDSEDDKKVIKPIEKPIEMNVEFYDSKEYNFHYSMSEDSKIKLYGVDKNAKIVFLHTDKKYAILINEKPYGISNTKDIKALKKINLDTYLK